MWLSLADKALIVIHTALIVFNCTGWAWRRTRRLHLWSIGLTAASWFVLGMWKGIGYCVCTDIHWQVRQAMGEPIQDQTYVQFLFRQVLGVHISADLAMWLAGASFAVSAALSVWLNVRDVREQRLQTVVSAASPGTQCFAAASQRESPETHP